MPPRSDSASISIRTGRQATMRARPALVCTAAAELAAGGLASPISNRTGEGLTRSWQLPLDHAVVDAYAQRIVAIDRLERAHHREILPWPTEPDDLDPRALAGLLALAHRALQEIEHLRVGRRRPIEHGIVAAAFGIEAEGRV